MHAGQAADKRAGGLIFNMAKIQELLFVAVVVAILFLLLLFGVIVDSQSYLIITTQVTMNNYLRNVYDDTSLTRTSAVHVTPFVTSCRMR